MDAAEQYGINQYNKRIRAIANAIKAVQKAKVVCSYSVFLNSAEKSLVNALLEEQVIRQKQIEVSLELKKEFKSND
jgi:hypothetical protein